MAEEESTPPHCHDVDEPAEEESRFWLPGSPVKRMTLAMEDGTERVWEGIQLAEYKKVERNAYKLAYRHGSRAKAVAPTRTSGVRL